MSSRNIFSSNQQKPQRRIGRRSMALNCTNNNTTLNGTLNGTAKPISDFSYKVPYEPSCASTPLPDHAKNKENIYLSSIKPVLASSPKLSRQGTAAPYQTQKAVRRLVRRSMALRTQDIHTEEASLNDSLTRMRDINASLKLSDPKQQSESIVLSSQPSISNATGNGSSFQSSMNSFLNYDFLKKFLPSSAAPAPLSSSPHKPIPPSPLGLKPKYESVLKNATICEMISESPTATDVMAQLPAQEEDEVTYTASSCQNVDDDDDDFLKKSLNCDSHKMAGARSPSEPSLDSKYGSFLEEMSPPALAERESKDEMEYQDNIQDAKPSSSISSTKPIDQSEDAHNRTFELEDQPASENLVFKTPQPPKFFKKDTANESLRTPLFKTPRSSVFSRFTNNDDGNDSFVENERTIMLQFRNEMMEAKKSETFPTTNGTNGDSNVVTTASDNVTSMSNASSNVNGSVDNSAAHVITTSQSIATHVTSASSNVANTPTNNTPTNTSDTETNYKRVSISNGSNAPSKRSSNNFEVDSTIAANTSNVTNVTKTGSTSNIHLNTTTGSTSSTIATLSELVAKQQRDLAELVARQNEELNRFIGNMNMAHNDATKVQNPAVPTITIDEVENSNTSSGPFENTATNGFDKTMKEKSMNSTASETMINNATLGVKPTGESGNETCVDTSIVNETQQTIVESTGNESILLIQPKSNTKRTIQTRQSILSQTLQEEDEPVSVKPRQSLAYNNFKRNCSILKTPARGNRKSYANSTAVFTPGTLSSCIRDQLEALEQE
uniref:Uncharacterized protein n=1 Tax=Cacopsylla melanoneura TaxID=428564 RepID=A0A8D8YJI2_9HEMI